MQATQHVIKLDDLTVTVANDGEDEKQWDSTPRSKATVYRYTVRVESADTDYETKAWGSIKDYEQGNDSNHEDMGWLVLDELLSAYYDPDEFWNMAVSESTPSREDVENVLRLLEAAKALGEDLERNQEAIDAHR